MSCQSCELANASDGFCFQCGLPLILDPVQRMTVLHKMIAALYCTLDSPRYQFTLPTREMSPARFIQMQPFMHFLARGNIAVSWETSQQTIYGLNTADQIAIRPKHEQTIRDVVCQMDRMRPRPKIFIAAINTTNVNPNNTASFTTSIIMATDLQLEAEIEPLQGRDWTGSFKSEIKLSVDEFIKCEFYDLQLFIEVFEPYIRTTHLMNRIGADNYG